MGHQINKNFAFLVQSERDKSRRGAILEGSSRSGKTISSVDFIIYIGSRIGTGFTINCIKETYNSFKTTLYDDFNKRMGDFGIESPFERSKEVATFNMLGNKVNLIGALNAEGASKAHGMSCDYMYLNEMLDIEKDFFDQAEMRCRKFWWGDYNPKVTDHWVFDKVIPRDDVGYLHSTFRDNPFISDIELAKILSYEDTPDNRRQGTVDVYKWKVYGLGIRAAMEGLIHPNVTWIDEYPEDIDEEAWGLDFGYTQDPSALVRCGVKGKNLFLKKYIYSPTPSPDVLAELLFKILPEYAVVWADSADPLMISDLKYHGLPVYGIKKFPGSINYGNNLVNKFNIHIVRDSDFRKEQENYKYREINGIKLNEPIDKFNHLWDATRYGVMGSFFYYL